jgi:Flp pilus assembly protein TadD
MILPLIFAAAVAFSPVATGPLPHDLLNDAQHAIDSGRLEQANIIVGRAIGAHAAGPQLARVLAALAFAKGNYAEALARYQSLAGKFPNDSSVLEHAGMAALRLDELDCAKAFLIRATALRTASWRAWNARGVAADMSGDWVDADLAYRRAAHLAPDRAAPMANLGWSLVLRGSWREALPFLEKAAELDPHSARIVDDLQLAKDALADGLPERQPNETDSAWAERLNDAGVAAAILGNKPKATAAFTQALEASGTWYVRAANNLEAVKER